MDRIATSTTYQSALLGILQAENRQADAQQRVSSGYIGDDLKAYAGHADTLTATKTVAAKIDAYVNSAARAADRLSTQDQSLNAVSDSATGSRKAVLDAVANGDGSTLMATLQGWYAQAVDALNANVGGDYVFAGGKTTTKPIASDQLTDLPATGPVSVVFNNDTNKAQARLDDNITLTTGVLASDAGTPLFSALQQIVAFNAGPNGPFSGQLTPAQTTFLQSVLPTLQSAGQQAVGQVAANAVAQTRVQTAQAQLADRKTAADTLVGKFAEADPAKAAVDLNLATTALQASSQVFSVLKGSSLLNILTAGG
jgi:flagellar hook-associated protein 3 FlgL